MSKIGSCSNPECEAHNMRVTLVKGLCIDCLEGRTPFKECDLVSQQPQMLTNYKAMSEDELLTFVADCMSKAEKATTRVENNMWKSRARRTRNYLPSQECALNGCTNMCVQGNQYCSTSCAGKAAAGKPLRFVDEPRQPRQPGWGMGGCDRPIHVIEGGIDAMFDAPAWLSADHTPCL